MWHISKAKYSKKYNAVAEDRIKSFQQGDHEKAIRWLNKHSKKPLILWHENTVNLDNPELTMVKTKVYKQQYLLIGD